MVVRFFPRTLRKTKFRCATYDSTVKIGAVFATIVRPLAVAEKRKNSSSFHFSDSKSAFGGGGGKREGTNRRTRETREDFYLPGQTVERGVFFAFAPWYQTIELTLKNVISIYLEQTILIMKNREIECFISSDGAECCSHKTNKNKLRVTILNDILR